MLDTPVAPTRRYWCPPDGRLGLDDAGFLNDPTGRHGKVFNPDLLGFEEIADRDCLILLGEPGMGKTASLEVERGLIERAIDASDGVLIWRDLGAYGDESDLGRDLFECPEWDDWRTHGKVLHL